MIRPSSVIPVTDIPLGTELMVNPTTHFGSLSSAAQSRIHLLL